MKKTKTILTVILIGIVFVSVQSCSSSGGDNDACVEYTDQEAQGDFKGRSFTVQGGTYREQFGEFFCRIYTLPQTGGSCAFPDFDGDMGTLIFTLSSLDVQTITLSATGNNTLNFNSIDMNTTLIELAECGTIEITNYDANSGELQGTVVAVGQDGSTINGNFTLQVCN